MNEDVEITIGEGDTKLSVLLDKVFYEADWLIDCRCSLDIAVMITCCTRFRFA